MNEKKPSMRMRRLKADEAQMEKYFRDFPLIELLETEGSPPEKYLLRYNIKGLARGNMSLMDGGGNTFGNTSFELLAQGFDSGLVERDEHMVEIQLTREYPRQSPKCTMLTPIFHPNIDTTAICIGDHWTAQERLAELVVRIGRIISFQNYGIQSPLDGEAAMWTDINESLLPVDSRDLCPPDL